MEETLVTATPAAEVAQAAATSPVEGKAADTVADAAKEAESQDETLLGKEGKKEEASAAPVNKAPEKYDFKVPEGMTLDAGLVEKVSPVFKEIGLTQEQAQKLVDAYAPHIKGRMEAQQKELSDGYKKVVDGWKSETQKELGADTQAKLAVAAKAINKFGTPGLRELLNETGVGNHKELVNFFIKVGSLLSEDHFAEPNKQGTGDSYKAFIDRNYPSMKAT